MTFPANAWHAGDSYNAATPYARIATRLQLRDFYFFMRYFFMHRNEASFIQNWHHQYLCSKMNAVRDGKINNLLINVPPASTKTEMMVIYNMAHALSLNPRARFLHISYSSDLVSLNSRTVREILGSQEHKSIYNLKISSQSKAVTRWNLENPDNPKETWGGCYAVALGGAITGFRAGHMEEMRQRDGTFKYSGAILVDDPLKPEAATSEAMRKTYNNLMNSTVASRRATPRTPMIVIQQRLHVDDTSGFILDGNMKGKWEHIRLPALMDEEEVAGLPPEYKSILHEQIIDIPEFNIDTWDFNDNDKNLWMREQCAALAKEGQLPRLSGKVSIWEEQFPAIEMYETSVKDPYNFASQWQQEPVTRFGSMFGDKGWSFYDEIPDDIEKCITTADTAQKVGGKNDFSVFQCWGMRGGCAYLLHQIRGKWEYGEMREHALKFYDYCRSTHVPLASNYLEDNGSGTALGQELNRSGVPVEFVTRKKNKEERALEAQPYVNTCKVFLPRRAHYLTTLLDELTTFPNGRHDDQVDATVDGIVMLLNKAGMSYTDDWIRTIIK